MKRTLIYLLLAGMLFVSQYVTAQTYAVSWWTIDGGGGTCSAESYQLTGTIGQPDASVTPLTGGTYEVRGGFWGGGIPNATYQPDMQIRLVADATYTGIHTYNDLASQTKNQTVLTNQVAVYNLKVTNDGNIPDTYLLTANTGGSGWTVTYYDALAGGSAISAITTGAGWSVTLDPNASREFRVEVIGDGTVRGGIANTVQVTATSTGDSSASDTVKAVTTKAALGTPTLIGVPGSPTAIGIKVKLDATVAGGGASQLAFRYRLTTAPSYTYILDYGTATTCNWTPTVAGNYFVQVLAREIGSTAEYDTYKTLSYTVKPAVSAVDLTSSLPSPTVIGMSVRFTATPTGGAALRYWFRYKLSTAASWIDLQPYGTANTYTWLPTEAGTFMVQVLVQEVGSTKPLCDVYKVVNYTVKTPLTAVSLASNPATSGLVGAAVRLVALPTGGGTVQYWFRAKRSVDAGWTDIQPYTTSSNVCYWTPAESGAYTVQVLARENGKTTLYDVNKVIPYTARYAVATVDLTTSPVSPVVVGTTVTLTASSTGSTSPHYWFRVMRGSTWTDLQAYSALNTCDWTPTIAGTYTVEVLARDSRSTRAYDVVKVISFVVRATP